MPIWLRTVVKKSAGVALPLVGNSAYLSLAPMIVQQIFSIITEINQQGTTVLLVEQNAQQALQRANRAYVLETGRIVRADAANVLLGDESVRAAYLGAEIS